MTPTLSCCSKKRNRILKFLLLSLVTLLVSASNFKADDIVGFWLDESKKLIVECYDFENRYYARIRWFNNENKNIEKFSENGLPKSKWLNYKVMEHFVFNGSHWDKGVIHQIKKGNTYDATIHMKNKNMIVVRGYVLISLLGEDVKFTRYFGALPKQE